MTPPSSLTRAQLATARAGIAAITCALVFDDRQLERVVDDGDAYELA